MSSPYRDDDHPAGLVLPTEGQVTPLTPAQQKALTSRRRFLQATVGGSLAAIGVAFAFPVLAIKSITQYSDTVATGDLIGDPGSNTPIDVANFPVNSGAHTGVIGKSTQANENLLEIVRIGQAGTADDFRVYSRICTHLRCPVSPELNELGNIWCGCHGSNFHTQDGTVAHGPAARRLPELPVTMDDQGRLIVDGDYNDPIA